MKNRKRFFSLIPFLSFIATSVHFNSAPASNKTYRVPNYGMAGCGPGAVLLFPEADKSVGNQLSIASSNDSAVAIPFSALGASSYGTGFFGPLGLFGISSSAASAFFGGVAQGVTIASGSSNCTENSMSKEALINERKTYLAVNMDALSKEAAQGRGEHLHAFAEIFGCSQADGLERFAEIARHSHQSIFSDSDSDSVLSRWTTYLDSDGIISRCRRN